MHKISINHILLLLLSTYFSIFYSNHIDASHNVVSDMSTVIATGDNWCPYTCDDSALNNGLMVDIVEAAFNKVNINLKYEFRISWSRAIQNVKNGAADILLPADQENSAVVSLAKQFFIYDETVFVVRNDSKIKLTAGKDLFNYKIGVISEYGYDDNGPWEHYIEEHPSSIKISASKGEPHLLKLLARNRIEIAILNWDVAKNAIKTIEEYSNLKIIRQNVLSKLYPGFAHTDRGIVFKNQFLIGFSLLVGTEQLANIYRKYDIELPTFTNNRIVKFHL